MKQNMQNQEVLLGAIGAVQESLVPDLDAPAKPITVRKLNPIRIGGICAAAAAVGAGIWFLAGQHRPARKDPPASESSQSQTTVPGSTTEAQRTESQQTETQTAPPVPAGPVYAGIPDAGDAARKSGAEALSGKWLDGSKGGAILSRSDVPDYETPWEDAFTGALPVYRDCTGGEKTHFLPVYLSAAQTEQIGRQAAANLGLTVTRVRTETVSDYSAVTDAAIGGLPVRTVLQCSGAEISVSGSGTADIWFTMPMSIPAAAQENPGAYLASEYAALLQYHDAGYYCENYGYPVWVVYEKSADPAQMLTNASLSRAEFRCSSDGVLNAVTLYRPLCAAEYLGDYPVISEQNARAKLLAGQSLTSVTPDEYPDGIKAEQILRVIPEYLHCGSGELILPCYRYYVALTAETCGVFYVPAVDCNLTADAAVHHGN